MRRVGERMKEKGSCLSFFFLGGGRPGRTTIRLTEGWFGQEGHVGHEGHEQVARV